MVFYFPLDAKVLAIPLGYACVAFAGLIAHTVFRDPEMTRNGLSYYENEDKVGKLGDGYLQDCKKYFDARINRHAFGVFNNEYKVNPK